MLLDYKYTCIDSQKQQRFTKEIQLPTSGYTVVPIIQQGQNSFFKYQLHFSRGI